LARSLKDYLPKKEKSICFKKWKTALKMSAPTKTALVATLSAVLAKALLL